jgi:hypothetical protein
MLLSASAVAREFSRHVLSINETKGAVCWSVQLLPQIWINYRRHDTTGLQPTMMLLWACAGVPLGVYNVVEDFNVALQVQPQILACLSLITWAQCKYYGNRWKTRKICAVAIPVASLMGGIETGLIFTLKHAKDRHLEWPVTLMAVLSACFLCAGVLRHYWDIYKERTVRGISFVFIGIDAMGDLTSLISVFFQRRLDVLGMVIYGSELILWLGVFACGGWFNLKPWLEQRSRRADAGTGGPSPSPSGIVEGATMGISRRASESSSVFHTAMVANESRHEASMRLRAVPSTAAAV